MADCFTPLYTTVDSVKVRLSGKVPFESPDDPVSSKNHRSMPSALLYQLISDAETAVEQDLRGRYAIPFRSIKSNTWAALPDHTRRAIRTLVDFKACTMIMDESFGSGTHINADGYTKKFEDSYQLHLRRLLGQDLEGSEFGERRFRRTPPLEDLRLAATNSADVGGIGVPLDSAAPFWPDGPSGIEYAADQINDPSRNLNWFGGRRGPR